MFRRILIGILLFISIQGFAQKEDRMNHFINGLMSKMTLDEKVGQLNLIAPGGEIQTGEAGSSNVEAKIKEGKVGALFAVTGVERIRHFQEMAVKESRSIHFTITEEELKFFNSNLQWIAEHGDFKVFIGTDSENVKEAKFSFSIAA
ncbi:fibronectin type III-like domain-contianing protein [Chitinophagaceae bacterium LB-8]|uniref:Fibronectin type III-like domain-contianing protein n=1 Tax=Paraflavisolibacter caeni TaxID=2982496 RepID=A0A9X3BI83_9BACT|nr:fibronectin type III-like domain-contianing protein [Paraflavisolibacter caeni]MCU7549773.1 fibronectin type III-like domain-contianing protein [Paraflavisolibacter caeni]